METENLKKAMNGEEPENDEVEMDKEEYISEHKNLIRILREGTLAEREAEADRQQAELDEYINGEENNEE